MITRFWGALLLMWGVTMLLGNLGVWAATWAHLWPLVFLALGFALLGCRRRRYQQL